MERTCMPFLINWLHSKNRLPLVIRGARQVGKTWLARHLASTQGLKLIELNFEEKKELSSAFTTNDPIKIVQNLEDIFGLEKIDPTKSLLFLDEIQTVPQLYAKLRWFAEKMPELAVISAGSLLEFIFKKSKKPMSMPVGRVEFMYVEPLSFQEFLLAQKKDSLVRLLHRYTWKDEIPNFMHDELMSYFKEYLLVGGMPAVVSTWASTRSLQEVSKVQQNIIASFKGDFHKYAGRLEPDLIEKTMKQVPLELGKKFVYSKITTESQVPALKKSLELLCKARICHKVISTSANGIPLEAEQNNKFFKVVFLDVGLCSASLKLSVQDIKDAEDVSLINSGGIAEQVVGQLLRTIEPAFLDTELYYWLRYESDAEIDYVAQHGLTIVPIEVKAGKTGTLKSLHFFMISKKRSLAIRVYSGMPLRTQIETKDLQGAPLNYEIRSIPFYLLGELHRLCD